MSLAGLLFQTATVASETGRDSYGKPTFGAQRTIKVRCQPNQVMTKNARGEDAMAHHRIYTLDAIALTDRIWVPGANTALAEESNTPLSVQATPDGNGSRVLYRVDL